MILVTLLLAPITLSLLTSINTVPGFAEEIDLKKLEGAWRAEDTKQDLNRLIFHRGDFITRERIVATYGKLIPAGGSKYRYVIGFVQGKPVPKVIDVYLTMKDGRLIFGREDEAKTSLIPMIAVSTKKNSTTSRVYLYYSRWMAIEPGVV